VRVLARTNPPNPLRIGWCVLSAAEPRHCAQNQTSTKKGATTRGIAGSEHSPSNVSEKDTHSERGTSVTWPIGFNPRPVLSCSKMVSCGPRACRGPAPCPSRCEARRGCTELLAPSASCGHPKVNGIENHKTRVPVCYTCMREDAPVCPQAETLCTELNLMFRAPIRK